jgi:hypothetical protein
MEMAQDHFGISSVNLRFYNEGISKCIKFEYRCQATSVKEIKMHTTSPTCIENSCGWRE